MSAALEVLREKVREQREEDKKARRHHSQKRTKTVKKKRPKMANPDPPGDVQRRAKIKAIFSDRHNFKVSEILDASHKELMKSLKDTAASSSTKGSTL